MMYMKPREVATKFKMSHWAGIIRECKESGLSIRAFCENAGFHENRYYYWQKKLREMACEELALTEPSSFGLPKTLFAEVTLPSPPSIGQVAHITGNQVNIEVQGIRITAGSEYPVGKLSELLRETMR